MCKAWATRAARSARRSLGTCKRPHECLISRRDRTACRAWLGRLTLSSTYAVNTDPLKRGASAAR
eukprot:419020-Prymnesium_polylepis.1